MQLLLKRNYLVLTIDHKSTEYVAARSLDGVVEHYQFAGMVHREDAPNGKPVWVLCNGWRYHSLESWRYLEGTDSVAGVVAGKKLYVILD